MTPHQITLVQASWEQVRPIQDTAASLFYGRLFELDPALRPMFKGDMAAQGRMLMAAIHGVVSGLTRLEALLPAIGQLARRHVGYGVQPVHYDTVGAALLWTLQRGLGDAFTPATHDAWAAAYGILAGAMKAAAYPQDLRAAA
ncbi:MAG: globin family protein [Aquabacterium sp.]